MPRAFHPLYLFRSAILLGVILLAASFAAYGILSFMISTERGYSGQSIFERIQLMVWFAVALYGILASFFIIIVGLFATHKVAGPLHRLELMLDEARSGVLPEEVHFREGDQLQPLARAQTVMFAYLILREREMAGLWARVEKSLGALALGAESASPEEWSRLAADLQSECSALAVIAGRMDGDASSPAGPLPGAPGGRRKGERGVTILELTVVMAIISILAAISVPLFIGVKDKATWGAAKGNVAVIRSALAAYAANSDSGRYPSSLTWADLSTSTGFLRNTNLPPTYAEARLVSMAYSTSPAGDGFTIMATVLDRFSDTIKATPAGITPATYPH